MVSSSNARCSRSSTDRRLSTSTSASRAASRSRSSAKRLDLGEQRGDVAVVGLEPVHGRIEVWGSAPDRGEEPVVLATVVGVQELAVAQAGGPQLEERSPLVSSAARPARTSGAGAPPRLGVQRQLAHRCQVAAEHRVHPAELVGQGRPPIVCHGFTVPTAPPASPSDQPSGCPVASEVAAVSDGGAEAAPIRG